MIHLTDTITKSTEDMGEKTVVKAKTAAASAKAKGDDPPDRYNYQVHRGYGGENGRKSKDSRSFCEGQRRFGRHEKGACSRQGAESRNGSHICSKIGNI